MIYDFWWDSGGKSSHFLVNISAPKEVVELMVQKYLRSNSKDSFVGFLRSHNIPARNMTPINVEFHERPISVGDEQMLTPDFARGAEIRHVQENYEII